MSGMITDLSVIGSIDRTADLLEIVDISANTSYKVTVNSLIGISGGSVVSTTDSQTVQNKTIDNTNTVTLKDTLFTLQDDGDTTKQARFQLSGITAGNIRTYTLPNASGTLVDLASAQTLTNKVLTSPTITGGSLDNTTVTVDAISGHTSATIVTVAGLQINNGIVGTNGVATASIADTAVTPAKLQSGTGTGWAWASWTPTWTNVGIGNGTVSAKYIQTGKSVFARLYVIFGTTSSITGSMRFTLPVTASADAATGAILQIGTVYYLDAGVTNYTGRLQLTSTTTADPVVDVTSGTYNQLVNANATVPFGFGNLDVVMTEFFYEAA